MVNLRIQVLNEYAATHNLNTIEQQGLKEWIVQMDAGKCENNRFHMMSVIMPLRRRNITLESLISTWRHGISH